jgi:hypothetical protein
MAERPGTPLILTRASVSRPSGQWREDDYDVIENGDRRLPHLLSRRGRTAGPPVDVGERPEQRAAPHDAWL